MIIIILACLLGIVLGLFAPVIPYEYSKYTAIAIIAAFDSVMGAINANLQNKFDIKIFTSGFVVNAIIASVLTYFGECLNIDIALAAIVVFVTRIFANFSSIRRILLQKHYDAKDSKKDNLEDSKIEKDTSNENINSGNLKA